MHFLWERERMNERGRKNARCKAMERNTTITTTITTTTRETRAHIPGNDNDDGTILTETLYFWIFWLHLHPHFLYKLVATHPSPFPDCPLPLSPSLLLTTTMKTVRYRIEIPTYPPWEIAISHLPRPSLFQDSCPSLSLLRLLIIHTVSLGLHVLNTHGSALLFSTSEESNWGVCGAYT